MRTLAFLIAVAGCTVGSRRASAQGATPCPDSGAALPHTFAGPPTRSGITACDLMTRLYRFADDTMRGRQLGTDDNVRATEWIADEARRLKLVPGGESGTFFQAIPLFIRALDSSSILVAGHDTLRAGRDFLANAVGQVAEIEKVNAVFGGISFDTLNLLPNATVKGKLVLLLPAPAPSAALQQTTGYKAYLASLAGATAVTVAADAISPAAARAAFAPSGAAAVRFSALVAANRPSPLSGVVLTRHAAAVLIGQPLDRAVKGVVGPEITVVIRFVDTPFHGGRNVVAIVPGTDAKLRSQYIVIGAHSDQGGVAARGVDHDSIRVVNRLAHPHGGDGLPTHVLGADEWAVARAAIDSLHRLVPPTLDSISNGADVGGSGTVSALEIAEALMEGKEHSRRSVLFVWHTGSERGQWGAQYFADNPTVPRDSIVAMVNLEMLGSARADTLEVLGLHRSSEVLANSVHAAMSSFTLDTSRDAPAHPANAWCRNDQAPYASWGIPALWFTTGEHSDAHTVADEPQYIRYEPMARIDRAIMALIVAIGNAPSRPALDKPPAANLPIGCRQ